MVADLQAEYGEHQYGRIDLTIPDDVKNSAITRARALKTGDPAFAGMKILRQENLDGVKFYLDNPEAATEPNAADTWLLLRASGGSQAPRIRPLVRAVNLSWVPSVSNLRPGRAQTFKQPSISRPVMPRAPSFPFPSAERAGNLKSHPRPFECEHFPS